MNDKPSRKAIIETIIELINSGENPEFSMDYMGFKVPPTYDPMMTWQTSTEIPEPINGTIQIGLVDHGFCQPKVGFFGGLKKSEYAQCEYAQREKIEKDESEQKRIERLVEKAWRIKRGYSGTRLFGALRRAGLEELLGFEWFRKEMSA